MISQIWELLAWEQQWQNNYDLKSRKEAEISEELFRSPNSRNPISSGADGQMDYHCNHFKRTSKGIYKKFFHCVVKDT